LTAHVVVDEGTTLGDTGDLRRRIRESLEPLGILHATIEVERESDCSGCGEDCHAS